MRQLRGACRRRSTEIRAGAGRAVTARADVADFHAVEAMIKQAEAQLGPVTILINNAGVSHHATLETFDDEQFERMRHGGGRPAQTSAAGLPGLIIAGRLGAPAACERRAGGPVGVRRARHVGAMRLFPLAGNVVDL